MPSTSVFLSAATFIILFFYPGTSFAIQQSPDSLINWLNSNPNPDTNRVKNLVHVSGRLFRSYPDSARAYGLEALQLAKKLDFYKGAASANRFIGYSYGVQGKSDSALLYFDDAIIYYERLGDIRGLATMNASKGTDYARNDDFELAMDAFLAASTYYQETGSTEAQGVMLGNIGNIFLEQELYEDAKKYYDQALDILGQPDYERSTVLVYSNLATVLKGLNRMGESIKSAEKGLELAKKYNNRFIQPNLHQSLAQGFVAKEDYTKAVANFEEAKRIAIDLGNKQKQVEVQYEMALILAKLGKPREAEKNLEEVITALSTNDYKLYDLYSDALLLMANVKKELGEFESGFHYAIEAKQVADSLQKAEMGVRIAELETIYETEKKEAQIRFLEIENELAHTRTMLISIFGGVLIILVIASSWLFYRKRVAEKRKKIEAMKSELQKFGLVISEKNNFISAFRNELDEIRKHVKTMEGRKELMHLVDSIHQNITLAEDEAELFTKIDQLNSGFYVELRKVNKELTEKDERLATLIQMELSNKDISNILHIEPNSVKKAKNRLKKKLNLNSEIDLQEYLKSLAA